MSATPHDHTLPVSLTEADFEAVAAHCFAMVGPIAARGEPVAPFLLAGRCRDGSLEPAFTEFAPTRSERDRTRLARHLESLVRRPQIDFVAYVAEAWMRRGLPEGGVADDPERMEAVLFNILSKDCQALVINRLRRDPPRLERGAVDFSNLLAGRFARQPPTRN